MGFSKIFGFLLLQEKKKAKTKKTGISEFGFFVHKWSFRDAHLFFNKCFAETPIFIVFFGGVLFGPSCQKRESLDTHPKKEKIDW